MSKVDKKTAEAAVKKYREAKAAKSKCQARMDEAAGIVSAYAKENVGEFKKNKLPLGDSIIKYVAGKAKPLKDGAAMDKSDRLRLAQDLPGKYVEMDCNYTALYNEGLKDKEVRRILQAHNVQIVREDSLQIN